MLQAMTIKGLSLQFDCVINNDAIQQANSMITAINEVIGQRFSEEPQIMLRELTLDDIEIEETDDGLDDDEEETDEPA